MKKKRHGFIWIILIVIAAIVLYKSGKLDGLLHKEAVLPETEAETARETKEAFSETEAESEDVGETEMTEIAAETTAETEIPETSPADISTEAGVAEKAKEVLTEAVVTPEFKAAMDSYEAFFDEYIDFMNKYKTSDDSLSMLGEYAEYMKRYAEMAEKMEAIEDQELSDADSLYYLEVTNRIEEKLYKAALNN